MTGSTYKLAAACFKMERQLLLRGGIIAVTVILDPILNWKASSISNVDIQKQRSARNIPSWPVTVLLSQASSGQISHITRNSNPKLPSWPVRVLLSQTSTGQINHYTRNSNHCRPHRVAGKSAPNKLLTAKNSKCGRPLTSLAGENAEMRPVKVPKIVNWPLPA
jgi:hypothetical protein